jgi:peroxiredoxin Q/BCP
MAQLRQDYQQFVERNTVVIAVGPDTQDAFEKYWEKNDMPFIGLADPDHAVARQYEQEVNLLKMGRIPAQMIIDKDGILRFVHYSKSMSDIPENKVVLKKIDEINMAK